MIWKVEEKWVCSQWQYNSWCYDLQKKIIIMKKATNAPHNKDRFLRSQWNAEFCLCAQHSMKQINTSGIETGIYKQISLYLIMSQQHVINHWEVNCSPPCKKKSLFDLRDKFGCVKLIATTTQTVWGPEGPSFTWDKKLQGRWLRPTMITWCYL